MGAGRYGVVACDRNVLGDPYALFPQGFGNAYCGGVAGAGNGLRQRPSVGKKLLDYRLAAGIPEVTVINSAAVYRQIMFNKGFVISLKPLLGVGVTLCTGDKGNVR